MKNKLLNKISNLNNSTLFYLTLLLGAILRIIFLLLNKNDLFTDSAFSIYYAKFSLADLTSIIIYDPTPPLYYLLLHFLMQINDSLVFLKLLHIAIGILNICAMYLLGKSLYDKRTGLIASFFTSLSFAQIYYSNEIRHYILWTLLITVSLLFLSESLKKNSIKNWMLFSITATLAFYTNYITVVYLLSIIVFFILLRKFKKLTDERSHSFKLSLLLIFVIVLPLILAKIFTIVYSLNSSGHFQLIGGFQPIIVYFYLVFEEFLFYNVTDIFGNIPIDIIILAFISIIFHNGLLKFTRLNKNKLILEIRNDNIVIILYLAFIFLMLICSFLGLYLLRYLLLLFPFFIIILSRGYININQPFLKRMILLFFIGLFLIAYPTFVKNANFEISKAAKQIYLEEKDKDLILIIPPEHFWDFNYYYKGNLPVYDLFINRPDRNNKNNELEILRVKSGGTVNKYNFVNEENVKNLESITAAYNRVWLVETPDYARKDPDSLVEKYFIKNWEIETKYDYSNAELFLFKK